MIDSTRPKPNRVKYAAMLLGAAAVVAAPLASPAIASAQKYLDIENYEDCMNGLSNDQMHDSLNDQRLHIQACCEYAGGVYKDDGYLGDCVAPPTEPTSGSRQFPGSAHIPSDIATVPVTKAPPRPIQVPSDIATAQAVSQAPA